MVDSGNGSLDDDGAGGRSAVRPEDFDVEALGPLVSQPIVVVDIGGNLAYFSKAAESLLGATFAKIGPLPPKKWYKLWVPTNPEGSPIPLDHLPIMVALRERRPMHGWLHIASLDGVRKWIEVTALPLEGPDGRSLGALGLFWDMET